MIFLFLQIKNGFPDLYEEAHFFDSDYSDKILITSADAIMNFFTLDSEVIDNLRTLFAK